VVVVVASAFASAVIVPPNARVDLSSRIARNRLVTHSLESRARARDARDDR